MYCQIESKTATRNEEEAKRIGKSKRNRSKTAKELKYRTENARTQAKT